MNNYYGHGSRMSADLKQVIKRVRKNRPEMFVPHVVREPQMDGNGKVTVIERKDVKAVAPRPAYRHALSISREYH